MKLLFLTLLLSFCCFQIAHPQSGWFTQVSDSNCYLDVSKSDANNVFVCGYLGKFIKTVNGGTNWTEIPTGIQNGLYSVSFPNESTGWIVGNPGIILKTTNGGNNWINQGFSGNCTMLFDVQFKDVNTGWAVGENNLDGVIIRTTNGGDNWFYQSFAGLPFRTVYFLNNLTGWVSGPYAHVRKTTDGGLTWTEYIVGIYSYTIYSIRFIDVNTGWSVWGINDVSIIEKTTNSGANWTIKWSSGTGVYLKDITFTDANIGWAVGNNSLILYTTNCGENWHTQTPSVSGYSLMSSEFINQNTGWICGYKFINYRYTGLIMKTTNGGNTIDIKPISSEVPARYYLYQNYPNPFNSMTNVKFQMSNAGLAILKIFDALGREVATLVNERLEAGVYEVKWDARHSESSTSDNPSGIYFCHLIAGDFSEAKRMLLLK